MPPWLTGLVSLDGLDCADRQYLIGFGLSFRLLPVSLWLVQDLLWSAPTSHRLRLVSSCRSQSPRQEVRPYMLRVVADWQVYLPFWRGTAR